MGTTRNSSHFRLILTRFIFDKGVKIEEEKTVRLLSAIAVALGLLATQTASALMPEKDSLSDLTTYQAQWLVEQGVEPAKARSLALEVEYGNPLDSMSGAEPISTQTSEEHGWILTRSEFADGSVSVSMLQTPGAELTDFSPRAVGNCGSTTSGSYWVQYTDCLVYGSNGYLQVGFHTNYYRGSGGSGISSVFSPYHWAAGGTSTTPVVNIEQSSGTASSPARAVASSTYSSFATSFTAYLRFYVDPSSAWTTQNF